MKAYVCDSCGVTIKSPHHVKMKEFFVDVACELGTLFPVKCSKKKKIQLCDECYKSLRKIAHNSNDSSTDISTG